MEEDEKEPQQKKEVQMQTSPRHRNRVARVRMAADEGTPRCLHPGKIYVSRKQELESRQELNRKKNRTTKMANNGGAYAAVEHNNSNT